MISTFNATVCCILVAVFVPIPVFLHALPVLRGFIPEGALRLEPTEAIVNPGDNATFICSHSSNVTFHWSFSSEISSYDVQRGTSYSQDNQKAVYYSRITFHSASRRMSGEIVCSVEDSKVIGFLIVNGVRNGGVCRASSDCMTDKATCQDGICECPRNYVRMRVKDRGFDVCREMIYSLYDPCEYDEQCSHLVDPKSICKSVCVCAQWARDRRGKCVAISEISYNRSQEMYRVGLIAVTCIIILIVAVSLWVTLKRSCHEQNLEGHQRSANDSSFNNRLSVDLSTDKPPSYDDILVTQDTVTSPPNMKDALKHCMTAKKLLRQVSAPAGELTSPSRVNFPKSVIK